MGRGNPDRKRPEHVATRAEVADWLVGSAVKAVTYHRTARAAADDIRERGINLERSRIGTFGQGFYTATSTEGIAGDTDVPVAIRTARPLEGDVDAVGEVIDSLARELGYGVITPVAARAVRARLVELGYDGIVVRDAGGDGVDYVVAILAGTVRVVVDE